MLKWKKYMKNRLSAMDISENRSQDAPQMKPMQGARVGLSAATRVTCTAARSFQRVHPSSVPAQLTPAGLPPLYLGRHRVLHTLELSNLEGKISHPYRAIEP